MTSPSSLAWSHSSKVLSTSDWFTRWSGDGMESVSLQSSLAPNPSIRAPYSARTCLSSGVAQSSQQVVWSYRVATSPRMDVT